MEYRGFQAAALGREGDMTLPASRAVRRAGTWRDELPRELAERILADHGPAMARFGYADELRDWLSGTT